MLRAVTIKIADQALAEIEAEARARRVSRSTVVRERLERAKQRRGSVWEAMHDLVTDGRTAPADLASNKSLLRGYGRSRRR